MLAASPASLTTFTNGPDARTVSEAGFVPIQVSLPSASAVAFWPLSVTPAKAAGKFRRVPPGQRWGTSYVSVPSKSRWSCRLATGSPVTALTNTAHSP